MTYYKRTVIRYKMNHEINCQIRLSDPDPQFEITALQP